MNKRKKKKQVKAIFEEYRYLTQQIDQQIAYLRQQHLGGGSPCVPNCYGCCLNTATLLISEVEGLDMKEGLDALSDSLKDYIRRKATKSIIRMESLGYTPETMTADSGNKAIDAIKGSPEAECPMLIGGVCVIYPERPVICRIWGYPMFNGDKVSCCRRTFKGQKDRVKPIDYIHYWRETKRLSQELGAEEKIPNCYMVVRLLNDKD